MNNNYVFNALYSELKKYDEYKDINGELLKSAIISKIKELDEKTLSIILSFEELKNKFTKTMSDITILDKQSLLSFFQSREFLPNSFTEFTNKIGLTKGLKFLENSDEVVLDFPYKDCVLLGNQSKEENEGIRQKFFHEVINFQEIDRLFRKKVLCNFQKHTTEGVVPINNFKETDNLIIKGNNLIALHTIKENFAGKVKLIYIDPPYNTESLKFAYNDKFDQATWLTFMKNRLEVAEKLLKDDGVLFVQIDDKQLSQLKNLMDCTLKSLKCKNIIAVEMSPSSGNKRSHKEKNLIKNKEFILFYGNEKTILSPLGDPWKTYDKHYSIYFDGKSYSSILEKIRNVFLNKNISYTDFLNNDEIKQFLIKESSNIYRTHDCSKWAMENVDTINTKKIFSQDKTILEVSNPNNTQDVELLISIIKKDGKSSYNRLEPLSWNVSKNEIVTLRGDMWLDFDKDMGNVSKEGNINLPNGKKPERLISDIIELTTNQNDIVLDYHLGSGTTCAVAHKMGRQYIGIEQLDYNENDSIRRLNNVIQGDSTGISKNFHWQGGGEFISMNLYSLVDEVLEKIKQSQSQSDIENIINLLLSEKYFYYLGINENKEPYEKVFLSDHFKNKPIEDQKRILHASIDKNNLYVDFNDLHDSVVNLSKEEKELNEKFYKGNK